jgi:hypothetical protein
MVTLEKLLGVKSFGIMMGHLVVVKSFYQLFQASRLAFLQWFDMLPPFF